MSATSPNDLPVLHLGAPRPPLRLSEAALRTWAEAAAVCLDEVGHGERIEMAVSGISRASRVILRAPTVDDTMRRTHCNHKSAVEKGAESIVACLVHDLTDYVLLEQAFDHTGFDYWLGDRSDEGPLFQKKVRLEISGILRETSSNRVEHRISKKIERLDRYPDERPAKIAIVEFSAPQTVVRTHG